MDSINTERSYTEYEVTEPTTDFAIGFDNYSGEDKDAIHVTLDGVNLDNLDYTVVRKNAQVIEVTPAIKSGVVRLQRETYIDQAFHTFTAGALFSPKSMDENFAQVRRSQQEVNDGFTFLAENTNGVVAAADAATARANAAAELAETTDVAQFQDQLDTQKLDTGITATAKFGGVARNLDEKLSENISLKDLGATDTDASDAVNLALTSGKTVTGVGLTYNVDSLPVDYKQLENAAFKLANDQIYPTDDYLEIDYSQITKTPTYTAWAEDKAFEHRGVIYVPIQLAHGHTYNTNRLAWVKSFDGGDTWTSPEILLDKHPNSAVYGWNSFSCGVIGNRFVMFVEERINDTKLLNTLYMYDRPIGFGGYKTGGIALVNGSSIATITQEAHGLVVGDTVQFSGVSGTGVNGLSGNLKVKSTPTVNTFTVDKTTPSTVTDANTGGSNWSLGSTFYNNDWRITNFGNLPDANGNVMTHVHSFTVRDATAGRFFAGFHTGAGSREVGFLDVTNFWTTPTLVKKRIPSAFELSAAEPSVVYKDGKTYVTTRSQSTNPTYGSSLSVSSDDGITWQSGRLPNGIHYTNLPFFIYDDMLYIFGTERRQNEWETAEITHYEQGRTRSYMLTIPLADAQVSDFSNMETILLGYSRYAGEQASSAVGVGSVVVYNDTAYYFFGSEDYRDSTRYSLNTPTTDNEYLADGMQPDIYQYRIKLKKPLAGMSDSVLRAPDNQNITVYTKGSERRVVSPMTYEKSQKFLNGINVSSGEIQFAQFIKGNNSDYMALMPDSAVGSDTRRMFIAGGGAPSASRGGMLVCYGANHATSPYDIRFATNTSLSPSSDNTADIGTASTRVKDVFTVNAVTSTSDANLKDVVGSPDDALIQPLLNIAKNIKVFKWKDGGIRKHVGVIAQEVYAEFDAVGIDAFEYGFIGKDLAYDDVITGQDADGQDIVDRQPRLDADGNHVEIWNVRHSELQYAILWAQIQKLEELN